MAAKFLFGRPYYVYPNSACRLFLGHDVGLVLDGDEMFVKLGKSGGRINLDTVLADSFLTSRTKISL